jgi:hypothetical protein
MAPSKLENSTWDMSHLQIKSLELASVAPPMTHATRALGKAVGFKNRSAHSLLKGRVCKTPQYSGRSFAVVFRSLPAKVPSSFDTDSWLDRHLDIKHHMQVGRRAGAVAEGHAMLCSSADSSEEDLALIWGKARDSSVHGRAASASKNCEVSNLDACTCADEANQGPWKDTLVVCDNPLHDPEVETPELDTLHWQIGALQQGALCAHRPDEHEIWANMRSGKAVPLSDGCGCEKRPSSPLSMLWRCMLCSDCADDPTQRCSHCSATPQCDILPSDRSVRHQAQPCSRFSSTASPAVQDPLQPYQCASPQMAVCEGVDGPAAQLGSGRIQGGIERPGLRSIRTRQADQTGLERNNKIASAQAQASKGSSTKSFKAAEREVLPTHQGKVMRVSTPQASNSQTGAVSYPVLSPRRSALRSGSMSPSSPRLPRSASAADADSVPFTEEISAEAAHVAIDMFTAEPEGTSTARQPRIRSVGMPSSHNDSSRRHLALQCIPRIASPRSKEKLHSREPVKSGAMRTAPAAVRQQSASACMTGTVHNVPAVRLVRGSLTKGTLMQQTAASAARARENSARVNLASIREHYDMATAPEAGLAPRMQRRALRQVSSSVSIPLPSTRHTACSRPASASAATTASHQRRLRQTQSSRPASKAFLSSDLEIDRKHRAALGANSNRSVTIGKPSMNKDCRHLLRQESSRQQREEARRRLENDLSKLESSLEHTLSQSLRRRRSIPPMPLASTAHSSRDRVASPGQATSRAAAHAHASSRSVPRREMARAAQSRLDCKPLGLRSRGRAGGDSEGDTGTRNGIAPSSCKLGLRAVADVPGSSSELPKQANLPKMGTKRPGSLGVASQAGSVGDVRHGSLQSIKTKLSTVHSSPEQDGKPAQRANARIRGRVQQAGRNDSEGCAAIMSPRSKASRPRGNWSSTSEHFRPCSPGVEDGMWEAQPRSQGAASNARHGPIEDTGLTQILSASKDTGDVLSTNPEGSVSRQIAAQRCPPEDALCARSGSLGTAEHKALAATAAADTNCASSTVRLLADPHAADLRAAADRNCAFAPGKGSPNLPAEGDTNCATSKVHLSADLPAAADRKCGSDNENVSAGVPAAELSGAKSAIGSQSLHAVSEERDINGNCSFNKASGATESLPKEPNDASPVTVRGCDAKQTSTSTSVAAQSVHSVADAPSGHAVVQAGVMSCNISGASLGGQFMGLVSPSLSNTRQSVLAAAATELELAARSTPDAMWKRGTPGLESGAHVAHRSVASNVAMRDGASDRMASTGSGGSEEIGRTGAASTRLVQMQAIHDSLMSLRLPQSPSSLRSKRALGSESS